MKSTGYAKGEPLTDLLLSIISHASVIHYSKNAVLLTFCGIVMIRYGIRARWLSALAFAVPVNYAYAHAFGPVIGASGGTFALFGVVTPVLLTEHRRATVAVLGALTVHQLTLGHPPVVAFHTIAFVVGFEARKIATGDYSPSESTGSIVPFSS